MWSVARGVGVCWSVERDVGVCVHGVHIHRDWSVDCIGFIPCVCMIRV